MGDVDLLTSSLQRALRGEPVDPAKLLRFVRRAKGVTANKRKMAAAALLRAPEYRDEAYDALDWILANEEASGPRTWEPLCPDPHAGMYSLAEVSIVSLGLLAPRGSGERRIAGRQLALTGQRLALYDLIATPDGDVTGLPGVRSNDPRGPHRTCESAEYREWRELPQRGPGGRMRPLKNAKPTSDDQAIFSAPAWWWRRVMGDSKRQASPVLCAALPHALPLALVVYRWPTGTLAYFEKPANPREWLTFGSAASKKDKDGVEDVCSSVLVNWRTPGKHEVEAVLSWKADPPVERVPSGATRTRIPSVGEDVKEGK